MTVLACDALGLPLRSPIIAGASPVTGDEDHAVRLERAGVGAVVLPSLFQEQLEPGLSPDRAAQLDRHNGGVSATVRRVDRLARRCDVPIIANLNGMGPGAWTGVAARLADAGAAAIELSITVVPTGLDVSPGDVEDEIVETARDVVEVVDVPVHVKIAPHVAAVGHLARRLVDAGARGLVLFGRSSMPDIDVDTGRPVAVLPLSGPDDLLVGLRWTAVLSRRLDGGIVTAGGIHTGLDVVKSIRAGADAVAVTSCLLRYGPDHVSVLRRGLARWMAGRGFESLDDFRGTASLAASVDPALVERAGYTDTLVEGSLELAEREALRPPARPSGP